MNRVLVTGASGFVGRAVVADLAASDHVVRAAVRRSPQPAFPDGVEIARHTDLTQAIDWRPLLDGVDAVVHLAGVVHARRSVGPEIYDRVNRVASGQLAGAAAQAGVSRFVYISSIAAQTGPSADHALTERDTAAPISPYGRSKLAAEEAVRASGVPFTILRPVAIYGAGARGNIGLFLRAALLPCPLPLRDFINRRSLLGVDNFISALRFVLATPGTRGETYVVADPGIPPRLCDIIAILREAHGRRPFMLSMPSTYLELPLRLAGLGDLWDRFGGNLRVDPAKLIAAGWRPAHDTRTGLASMAQNTSVLSRVTPPAVPPAPDRPRP